MTNNATYDRKIELDFCTVSLRDDGIIEQRFVWDEPYEITPEALIQIKESIEELRQGKRIAILVIPGQFGRMNNKAKRVDMFKDADKTIAIALVISSLSQRLMANFYFKINKAPYPVKFFNDKDKAESWLKLKMKEIR